MFSSMYIICFAFFNLFSCVVLNTEVLEILSSFPRNPTVNRSFYQVFEAQSKYPRGNTTELSQESSKTAESEKEQHKMKRKEHIARKPRKAAVRAMKKNKQIFDTGSEVMTDRKDVTEEPSFESPKRHICMPYKKRKRSQSNLQTDTETGSSEVSWLRRKKSCSLFETPKKSYSEWKKSRFKKNKLPVEIIQNKNSGPKKSLSERKKKIYSNNTISINSSNKSRGFGFSDLENFDLTIEKTTKRNPYSFMEVMESNFNTSPSSLRKSSNRKSHTSSSSAGIKSHLSLKKTDVALENSVTEDREISAQALIEKIPNSLLDENNKSKNINSNDLNEPDILNHHKIPSLEILPDECNSQNIVSEDIMQHNEICEENNIVDVPVSVPCQTEGSEDFQSEKHNNEEERVLPENALENSGGQENNSLDSNKCLFKESEGKHELLRRFLDSVAEYFETAKDSNLRKSDSISSASIKRKLNDSSTFINKAKKMKKVARVNTKYEVFEDQSKYARGNGTELCQESPKTAESQKEQHKMKRKEHIARESRESEFPVRKCKKVDATTVVTSKNLDSLLEQKSSLKPSESNVPEIDLLSRQLADSSFSSKIYKMMGSQKSMPDHLKQKNLHKASADFKKSKSSCSIDHSKKSKEYFDSSFDTIHLKQMADSLIDTSNRKWFDAIIAALSHDANALTRKLLGTVQKCLFDYSVKMSALRERIIKVAEILEMPSHRYTEENASKNLIKSSRFLHNEVEKRSKLAESTF